MAELEIVMLWIACVAALVFFYLWRRSKAESVEAGSQVAFSFTESWLADEGISLETVRHETYFGRPYALSDGAAVVVGTGRMVSDEVGFVAEINPRLGLISAELIRPASVATWHKQAAQQCRSSLLPLSTVLGRMAEEHEKQTVIRQLDQTTQAMEDIHRIVAEAERAKADAHEMAIQYAKEMTEGSGSPDAAESTDSRKQATRPADEESATRERVAALRSKIDRETRRYAK